MVAEQMAEKTRAEYSATMDKARGEKLRQPTLAEELDQVEKEARVTKARQAVEQHGKVYDNVISRRWTTHPRKHQQR